MESWEAEIWGTIFLLPIEFDCYEDESITPKQMESLKMLNSVEDWINACKKDVEQFCKTRTYERLSANIFSYLRPLCVYVPHDEKRYPIAILFDFEHDEHGVAVAFTSDGKVAIGLQDMVI